ncbi:hypothetical protein [Arenimonas oryziterrae]|uniref:Uncharacterized protein n=1 Tax=Arenimonas oryziterrae DSM 21050 = YC6267 TaxID=1121015 RepID=A0A091AUU9_9GAMM|nr:hypothetical protein [Arenimonas oryziterrae]KFN43022.1 hypothetical protein N789_10700 [Arenimonas oryziterrae DSM 21050 = YC6267]
MSHLILLAALLIYAVGLLYLFRRFGIGLAMSLASGVATVAFAWGALYLVYASDVLYALGVADMPAAVLATDARFGWLLRYIAVNGWIVGIVYFVPIWLAAALIQLLRPNNAFRSTAGLGRP